MGNLSIKLSECNYAIVGNSELLILDWELMDNIDYIILVVTLIFYSYEWH